MIVLPKFRNFLNFRSGGRGGGERGVGSLVSWWRNDYASYSELLLPFCTMFHVSLGHFFNYKSEFITVAKPPRVRVFFQERTKDAPACKNNRSKLFRSQFIISRIFLHSITEEKVDYEDQNVQQYRVEK